jgi:two-component system, OmpR family, response regulator MprA
MASRILLVDDDAALRLAVSRALELEGYTVDVAEDGLAALAYFDVGAVAPDVVVLDLLMPNIGGLAACRLIRKTSDVPILMLTARHEIGDRVEGLDAGADDYLGKPFAFLELLARLRALLRRSSAPSGPLRYADLELDPLERRVQRGDRRLDLTRIEFTLLALFLAQPRKVLTRGAIVREVWGYEIEYASNSLDVFIGYLRRKTEAAGEPRLIQTVRGVGYALREEPS